MHSWQMYYVDNAIIQVGSLRAKTLHVSLVSARCSSSSKCETLLWPVLKTITVISVRCVSTKCFLAFGDNHSDILTSDGIEGTGGGRRVPKL